ncbi:MAG: hypothetical protein AB8H79_09235 [Myxococcota bacterium]
MNRITLFGLAAVVLATAACSPKFLVRDYFIPDTAKVARETIEYTGSVGGDSNSPDIMNFYIQVCDLNDGKATNCKSTMVLDNVLTVNFWSTGF